MTDETYNGWKNYATWNTALWIDNEEGCQDEARRIVAEALNSWTAPAMLGADYWTPENCRSSSNRSAGEALKEWWEEINEAPTAGPMADAWTSFLEDVDWSEIVDNWRDDLPAIETNEDDEE